MNRILLSFSLLGCTEWKVIKWLKIWYSELEVTIFPVEHYFDSLSGLPVGLLVFKHGMTMKTFFAW